MDIFLKNTKTGVISLLLNSSAYDAESTISPDGIRASRLVSHRGKKIIFTSGRDGDLELYTMNLDATQLRRLTYTPGYDGGAYFSNGNTMFCWRANRFVCEICCVWLCSPQGDGLLEYFRLLEYGITFPSLMQIMVQVRDCNILCIDE